MSTKTALTEIADPVQPKDDTTPQYKRVTTEEAAKIYRLRREGLTLEEIADHLGRSLETIHRHLEAFERDTTEDAAKVLKASALPAAMKAQELLEHGDGRVALGAVKTVLQATSLLEQQGQSTAIGVQVVIGMPGQPAGPDPLQVVESKALITPEPIATECTLSDIAPNTEQISAVSLSSEGKAGRKAKGKRA